MEQDTVIKQIKLSDKFPEETIDLLDRKILAKNFLSVLISQDARVFSINGGWGSGKTWFLKFIQDECKSQPEPICFIKYNVWENDYLDNPLQSIASELTEKLDYYAELIFIDEDLIEVKKEINGIRKLYPKFIQLINNFKIKPKLAYTLQDGSTISTEIGLEYKKSKIDETNAYDTMKKIKSDFMTKLENTLALFKNKEIVIAIDELDRCRPDYAVRTLEIIKHFFHIRGLKFILAVDKQQLANTVKALYGQEANTDCYLRKFVDIEYNLPKPKDTEITKYVSTFIGTTYANIKTICETKCNSNDGILYFNSDSGYLYMNRCNSTNYIDSIIKLIINSANQADLRLRDLEKIFFKLNIIINQFKQVKAFNFGFLWNLLIMNTKYNDLYKLIEDENIDYLSIFNYLKSRLDDNYPKFIIENKEFMLIIEGIKHKVDNDYGYTRSTKAYPVGEIAFYYSLDLKKYFEIINMSIGFETI